MSLSPLLALPVVTQVLSQAPRACPVPAPPSLVIDVSLEPPRADPVVLTKVLRDGHIEFHGIAAITNANVVCSNLPRDRQWACRIRADDRSATAVVECKPETPSPPLPPQGKRPIGSRPAEPRISKLRRFLRMLCIVPGRIGTWPVRPSLKRGRLVILALAVLALIAAVLSLSQTGNAQRDPATQPAQDGRLESLPLMPLPTTRDAVGQP